MTTTMLVSKMKFPKFTGIRCLMMPYIQGDSKSVPENLRNYAEIIESVFFKKGDIGFLTIDESLAISGKPHRGARAKYGRALHTEAGKRPLGVYGWGGTGWGNTDSVRLDPDVEILLANNLDNTCALWDCEHRDTSYDGDIGYAADLYPYEKATMMQSGEVYKIGIFTPHESLPVKQTVNRQFLRIISSGVYGREPYFTENPLVSI
jgi:hypothetical protein